MSQPPNPHVFDDDGGVVDGDGGGGSGGGGDTLWGYTDATTADILNLNTGNVGIGTNPIHALDVNGTVRGSRFLGVDYNDLLNIPTPETDSGNFFVVGGERILTKTNYDGLDVRGSRLILSSRVSDSTAESLFDVYNEDTDDNGSLSALQNAVNPRLVWRGYAFTGAQAGQTGGVSGVIDESDRVSLLTITIIDEKGRISWNILTDLPDWISTIQSNTNAALAMGAIGTALGTLATLFGIGSAGSLTDFLKEVGDGFVNLYKGVSDAFNGGSSGDGQGGGGEGGGGEGGSGGDDTGVFKWRAIGERPFWTTPVNSFLQGGQVGFNNNVYVVNASVAGSDNLLAVITRANGASPSLNSAGNLVFDTSLNTTYVLINFNTKHIFCEKLRAPLIHIRQNGSIRFRNESGTFDTDDNYLEVLTLKKTQHGDWKLTDKGLFHLGNCVISYDATSNKYLFHGIATGETLLEEQQETARPPENIIQRFRRRIRDRFGNSQDVSDPYGGSIQSAANERESLLSAAERDAVSLAQENAELLNTNRTLQEQLAAQRRSQATANVRQGLKRWAQDLKRRAERTQQNLQQGFQRIVDNPQETAVRMRNFWRNAPRNIRGRFDQAVARTGDRLQLGTFYTGAI